MMLVLLLLMLVPMLMMVALTQILLLDAFVAATYADTDHASADAKMPNLACHLANCYVVQLLLSLLPMLMLPW
jgi:hypothetical protein